MTLTAGIDVGAGGVKIAILNVHDPMTYGPGIKADIIHLRNDRIRKRMPRAVALENFQLALQDCGLKIGDVEYIASTGDGEAVQFRRGHFYGMTAHARGGQFLVPEASTVLDIGALHARAIQIDPLSKVLGYRMTSQCASGSGQFLENIARYLGVTLEEVGKLSLQAENPEMVSGICAVLAETDVINMVSRGISASNILKGIHASMAGRLIKLLGMSKTAGTVALTGGLSVDVGLTKAIEEELENMECPLKVKTHPHAIFAGAIGAALWGAFRHQKNQRLQQAI